MTVYQNISMPLKARRVKSLETREKVSKLLKIINMEGYCNRYPNELSGGEKQRVALARALVYEPDLLLLDEPLANLDASLKEKMVGEIKHIQRELGVTTIYVTHDQSEAFDMADEIIVMNEGEIMQRGTPYELYTKSEGLFVSTFVGKNNIFEEARFIELFGQEILESRMNCRKKGKHHGGKHMGQSKKCKIAVRPEMVKIIETGKNLDNKIQKEGVFIGSVGEQVLFDIMQCRRIKSEM